MEAGENVSSGAEMKCIRMPNGGMAEWIVKWLALGTKTELVRRELVSLRSP